jgi:hypothetical protein
LFPATWELSAYEGDFRKGLAALDDGERVRFRVYWWPGTAAAHVHAAVRRYHRLVNQAANARIPLVELEDSQVPVELSPAPVSKVYALGDTGGPPVRAWASGRTGRVLVAETTPLAHKEPRDTAWQALASVSDTPREDDRLWAAYGFAFSLPSAYTLVSASLQPGRFRYVFSAGGRARLRIERWGMASQVLGQLPFGQWPGELMKSARLRPVGGLKVEPCEVAGFEGFRFGGTGREPGVQGWFRALLPVEGVLWHDPAQNRVIAWMSWGCDAGEAERLARARQGV